MSIDFPKVTQFLRARAESKSAIAPRRLNFKQRL